MAPTTAEPAMTTTEGVANLDIMITIPEIPDDVVGFMTTTTVAPIGNTNGSSSGGLDGWTLYVTIALPVAAFLILIVLLTICIVRCKWGGRTPPTYDVPTKNRLRRPETAPNLPKKSRDLRAKAREFRISLVGSGGRVLDQIKQKTGKPQPTREAPAPPVNHQPPVPKNIPIPQSLPNHQHQNNPTLPKVVKNKSTGEDTLPKRFQGNVPGPQNRNQPPWMNSKDKKRKMSEGSLLFTTNRGDSAMSSGRRPSAPELPLPPIPRDDGGRPSLPPVPPVKPIPVKRSRLPLANPEQIPSSHETPRPQAPPPSIPTPPVLPLTPQLPFLPIYSNDRDPVNSSAESIPSIIAPASPLAKSPGTGVDLKAELKKRFAGARGVPAPPAIRPSVRQHMEAHQDEPSTYVNVAQHSNMASWLDYVQETSEHGGLAKLCIMQNQGTWIATEKSFRPTQEEIDSFTGIIEAGSLDIQVKYKNKWYKVAENEEMTVLCIAEDSGKEVLCLALVGGMVIVATKNDTDPESITMCKEEVNYVKDYLKKVFTNA